MPEISAVNGFVLLSFPELVPSALRALKKGNTHFSIYMTAISPLDYSKDFFQERTLQSAAANTRQDGLNLWKEAGATPIRTHFVPFKLEEANMALPQLKKGSIQGTECCT